MKICLKNILIVLLFVFICETVSSQVWVESVFSTSIGAADGVDEKVFDNTVSSDGKLSFLLLKHELPSESNTILMAYHSEERGHIEWQKKIVTDFEPSSGKILNLSDGTILVSLVKGSSTTIFIKLDEQGELIWAKSTSAEIGEFITSRYIQPADDGGFYSILGHNLTTPGFRVSRFSPVGNLLWSKTFRTEGEVNLQTIRPKGVDRSPSGQLVILLERFNSSGPTTPGHQVAVTILDEDGDLVNSFAFDEEGFPSLAGRGVSAYTDHRISIVGEYINRDNPDAKAFVITFRNNGDIRNESILCSDDDFRLGRLVKNSRGNLGILGKHLSSAKGIYINIDHFRHNINSVHFLDDGLFRSGYRYDGRYYLFGTGNFGETAKLYKLGYSATSFPCDLEYDGALDVCNSEFLKENYSFPHRLSTTWAVSEPIVSIKDVFVMDDDINCYVKGEMKEKIPDSDPEPPEDDVKIKLFLSPNPAVGSVVIDVDASKFLIESYQILTMHGRIAIQGSINGDHTNVDLMGLQKGIYTVLLFDEKGQVVGSSNLIVE